MLKKMRRGQKKVYFLYYTRLYIIDCEDNEHLNLILVENLSILSQSAIRHANVKTDIDG